mgnify:CR=1 FL=1
MEHDLTRGNVLKTIAVFALPYMLSYFLQMLYGMADLYMMGQFSGAAGITAVGNGAQTLYIITVTLVGLAMGTTVIVGHAVGSRRFDRAETAIGNTITLFMGVSVVLAAILLALCPQIVALIGTPAEAVEGTAAYLRICFMGIPFIAAYNILSAIFRGLGDSRSPMYVIGVACIINIALDFLFIGHMGLGPVGAALGTVTAQTASVALALVWLKSRRTNIHVSAATCAPSRRCSAAFLRSACPWPCRTAASRWRFMFITVIANHRGLVDAAAVGLIEKMISFLFIVPSSMGATVSALTAQKRRRGQGRPRAQVLKDAMTISVVYGCLITVLMWLVAPAYRFFAKDAAVVAAGTGYMRSYIFDAIFAGIHICFSGFFAAYGKSYIGFAHNVLAVVLIRVPGAWLLSNAYSDTLFPMGIASPCGSILSAVICVVAFTVLNRRGTFDKLVA